MKNIIYTVVIAGCLAAGSFGGVVQFGNDDLALNIDWKAYGFTDNASTVNTATIVQDGITFALTATTSANLDLNSAGDLWGINGGNNNTRVDHDGTAGESVIFTFAVSGANAANLTGLSFGGMVLRYFAQSYEQVDLGDGTTTLPTLSGGSAAAQWIDYDTELNGLTALSLANVATWQLDIAAVISTDADPAANPTDFGFTQMDFEYTVVPEPATLGMFGLGALFTLLIRRVRA